MNIKKGRNIMISGINKYRFIRRQINQQKRNNKIDYRQIYRSKMGIDYINILDGQKK